MYVSACIYRYIIRCSYVRGETTGNMARLIHADRRESISVAGVPNCDGETREVIRGPADTSDYIADSHRCLHLHVYTRAREAPTA